MRTHTVAATAAALLAFGTLTACGADGDPAACKTAMAAQFNEAAAAGSEAKQSSRPGACDGVDDKTLERLAGEVTAEYLESNKVGQGLEDVEQDANDAFDDVNKDLDDIAEDLGVTPSP